MRKNTAKKGLIFVLSGPSGSGKTTLANKLITDRRLRRSFAKSISYSTRPRRANEKEGRDYFFINERQFRERLKAKKILEWTRYLGYYYATPRDLVDRHLAKGRHLVLCLDIKGALRVKSLYPESAVTIFIRPPSIAVLRDRIKKRGCKTCDKEVKKRLMLAKKELMSAKIYDYSVTNDNLSHVVRKLKGIILNKIEGKKEG